MKKIYVTPLCETVLSQMAHNLLEESRWGVNGVNESIEDIIEYTGDGNGEDGILFNSNGGSFWDDDSDLLERSTTVSLW